MNWPSYFCSAHSSFTGNKRLVVAAMCGYWNIPLFPGAPLFSSLPSYPFEVVAVFNEKTNPEKESATLKSFFFLDLCCNS